jgi:transcriptional regulator of acetoin/glycerol metabolism
VQAGRTLLVSHPATLSMLWAYELDMIRGDAGGRLIPFLPDRLHPFVARLRAEVEAGLAGVGLDKLEKEAIRQTLAMTSGNRELTAQMLGIGERTLYRKLKEYGLR